MCQHFHPPPVCENWESYKGIKWCRSTGHGDTVMIHWIMVTQSWFIESWPFCGHYRNWHWPYVLGSIATVVNTTSVHPGLWSHHLSSSGRYWWWCQEEYRMCCHRSWCGQPGECIQKPLRNMSNGAGWEFTTYFVIFQFSPSAMVRMSKRQASTLSQKVPPGNSTYTLHCHQGEPSVIR